MDREIFIENLKCGGCANSITKGLNAIDGVKDITIDVENAVVRFFSDDQKVVEVKQKLAKLGYPEVGDKNTVLQKAKSYVSCAVGKMSN